MDYFKRLKAHWDIFIVIVVVAALLFVLSIAVRPKITVAPLKEVQVDTILNQIESTKEDIIINRAKDTIFIKELQTIQYDKEKTLQSIDTTDLYGQYIILSNNLYRQ